jgi:ABC-type transport system involved in multi-copper enzyme maturation permease subunit
MTVVRHIALNVYRESVRDRVLYNLVFFALLIISASYLIGQLTAGQDVKIIKDLGLAAIALFGLFIAVFIGIGLVSKEVERRSVYAIIAKPVRRETFVLGKYAGLVVTLLVNVAVMVAVWYVVLGIMSWTTPPAAKAGWEAPAVDLRLLQAVVLIFVELMLVTAVALFFSTFSSPMVSAAMTFGLYIAGNFSADLKNLGSITESPAAAAIGKTLYYVLPNLASFDIKAQLVHGHPVTMLYMLISIGYGALYIAALLAAAMFIFSRRDFR